MENIPMSDSEALENIESWANSSKKVEAVNADIEDWAKSNKQPKNNDDN